MVDYYRPIFLISFLKEVFLRSVILFQSDYSDLSRVLRRHGYELRNPSGNYINVMRIEPAKSGRFLGIGARPERAIFLAQIGFPGWKDQVHKAALKRVREATNLISQDGCDTKVFFEDAEPLAVLISEYAEPLKRLANK
jgi:hypothetical protein